MTAALTPVLTAHWDEPDSFMIEGYRRAGGYRALAQALRMEPGEIIQLVKDSGLRGRAGFPTGVNGDSSRGATASRTTWSSTPTSPNPAPARTSR